MLENIEMALDDFVHSNYSRTMPWVSRDSARSWDSINLLHKDEHCQAVVASPLGKPSKNLSSTYVGISLFDPDKYCIAENRPAVDSESYLVPTEGISATANIDSQIDSFKLPIHSSHDLSKPQDSHKDALSTVQDVSCMNRSRVRKRRTSHHESQKNEDSLPHDIKQELHSSCLKKPRQDLNQEVVQKSTIKQLLQSKDSARLQGQMALQKALLQQNKLQNEHKELKLQSVPHFLGIGKMQHVQEPEIPQVPALHPFEGVCFRRLMQYVYHLRHRPPENSIAFWRKFVEEYYAPHAKKRWCLSMYGNAGHPSSGLFTPADMDQWNCDLCGSRSGKGFEVTSEVLPRLNKVSFESGMIDEILFLDLPREHRLPSGLMVLDYDKAVQECVYERLRIVREGKLRIIFTVDLKILSWEFCARNHEELLQRSFIGPRVGQLVHAARNYESTINGTNKVSKHDLEEVCSRFLKSGTQLARSFDLQLIDDIGFSRRYIRCLQISGVVESMKDLMTFSRDNNIGPIEGLKKYAQRTFIEPFRGEGKEKLPFERERNLSDCNKFMALSPDFNNCSKGNLNTTLKYEGDATMKAFRGPTTSCRNDLSSYNHSESGKNSEDYMAIQKWFQEMFNNNSGLRTKAERTDELINGLDFSNSRNSSIIGQNMKNVSAASNVLGHDGFIKRQAADAQENEGDMVHDCYKTVNSAGDYHLSHGWKV